MKRIETQGITYIEPLDGSRGTWYWGTDYASGDLYEAQELFQDGYAVSQNKLIFVHYPDGRAVQPVAAKQGQYFGRPIFYRDKITILLVDFPAGTIGIMQFDDALDQITTLVEIPLSTVEDCYNLMLKTEPLMLTRQGMDDKFQIIWPESAAFPIGEREAFLFRDGKKLYFATWQDEPEYREEILIRSTDTGAVIDRIPGAMMSLPDGQKWILT